MFSTEIILNALLYSLGQAMDSVEVCGTDNDAKLLYKTYCELCSTWGVDEVMQEELFQYDSATQAMLNECAKRFK